MPEFAAKVDHLVGLALATAKVRATDRELGQAFDEMMRVFDRDDARSMKAAIVRLDAGLAMAKEPRSEQLLRLAIGVLVENGAAPELAWPIAERGLMEAIATAKIYAQSALDSEDTPSITEAIRCAAQPLQDKMPREAAAWNSLKSRALLAIACLSRSPKLRLKMQKSRGELIDAMASLEDDVESLLFLRQIMRVLPDQTMLAIHPEQRRGVRVFVKEITTNIELMVLLHDAVLGDPRKGLIDGRRPNHKAIAALKDPERATSSPVEVTLPFFWSSWRALRLDGTLPRASDQRPSNGVRFEGVPIEILPFNGERVILLTKPLMRRAMRVEGSFEGLAPSVTLKQTLSDAEVGALLLEMGKAAVEADAIAFAKEELERAALRKHGDAEPMAAHRALDSKKKARAGSRAVGAR